MCFYSLIMSIQIYIRVGPLVRRWSYRANTYHICSISAIEFNYYVIAEANMTLWPWALHYTWHKCRSSLVTICFLTPWCYWAFNPVLMFKKMGLIQCWTVEKGTFLRCLKYKISQIYITSTWTFLWSFCPTGVRPSGLGGHGDGGAGSVLWCAGAQIRSAETHLLQGPLPATIIYLFFFTFFLPLFFLVWYDQLEVF